MLQRCAESVFQGGQRQERSWRGEPGAKGLKAGLWDYHHSSHLPIPPLCSHCRLFLLWSNRVLSQGTSGHNRGLLLSPTALNLVLGTGEPFERK